MLLLLQQKLLRQRQRSNPPDLTLVRLFDFRAIMKMNALGIAPKELRAFHEFLKSLNGGIFIHKINMGFAVLTDLQMSIRNEDAVFTARQAFDINGVCGKSVGKGSGSHEPEEYAAGQDTASTAGAKPLFFDGEAHWPHWDGWSFF